MKKILLVLLSLLIGLGLFVWIGKITGWQEIKQSFLLFTGWQGFVILGLTLLMMLIGTWKWREILKGENITISFRDLFKPYILGFSIMFLAPILLWGGEVFRSYILKKNNSIPWSKGMASVIIERILEWTANLIIIFFGLLFFLLMIGLPPIKLLIIFGGIFFVFSGFIFYFYFKTFKGESMAKFFLRKFGFKDLGDQSAVLKIEKEIFNFFKPRQKLMWKGVGLSFLRAAVMYVRTWLLIVFLLGKGIGILPALSVLGFSYLAVMIPIPAALGSHEAIQTFAFNSLGLGASSATAFTMIIRGAETIIALMGIMLLFKFGLGFIYTKLNNLKPNNFNND